MGLYEGRLLRWYQILSGYTEQKKSEHLYKDDIDGKAKPQKTRENVSKERSLLGKIFHTLEKKIRVHVFKWENMGEHLAIDDKMIGGELCTILSNKITKKAILIVESVKSSVIIEMLSRMPGNLIYGVKTMSRDLAGNYERVGDYFLNAIQVADKFHVLALAFEALQMIRMRYKRDEQTKERLRAESHKVQEAEKRDMVEKEGKTYKPKKCPPPPLLYPLGESTVQLLTRSKYLLFVREEDWTESQKERSKLLFYHFPELKTAYTLVTDFRDIYEIPAQKRKEYTALRLPLPDDFHKQCEGEAKKRISEWQKSIGAFNCDELQNFSSTVSTHKSSILSYFLTEQTNAFAESLNAKIQRFIISNYGIKNRDFFFFRLSKFIS